MGTAARTCWISVLCFSLLIALLKVSAHILIFARVYGTSMKPTIQKGDCVVGILLPRRRGIVSSYIRNMFIQKKAIVLVRPPLHLGRLEVKRIQGVAGDYRIWGWDSALTGLEPIPEHHVFLLGDAASSGNKTSRSISEASVSLSIPRDLPSLPSADSQSYGPCPAAAIVARVFMCYWPPRHLAILHRSPTKTLPKF